MHNSSNKDIELITVEDLFFSYGEEEVLSNINLSIKGREYVGILGPNGAGKSTLIKIILGLLNPTKGSVKIFGKKPEEFTEKHKISYVAQTAINFDINFPATVLEVVLMGRYAKKGLFRGLDTDDKKHAEAALKHVEMWEYRNRLIGDLSGGQKQRIFIARALVSDPEIIFLDEPTTGIDAQTENEFYNLLRKLNSEFGLTLILVSHDTDRVIAETNRIICVDHRLVCDVGSKEFAHDERYKNIFEETYKHVHHPHA